MMGGVQKEHEKRHPGGVASRGGRWAALLLCAAVLLRIARRGPARSSPAEFAATAGVLLAVLLFLLLAGRRSRGGGGGLLERFVDEVVVPFDRSLFQRLGDLPSAVGRRVTRGIENVMDAHVNESSNDASPDADGTFVTVTAETLGDAPPPPPDEVTRRAAEYVALDDLLARLKNVAPEAYARVLRDVPEEAAADAAAA
jgi:hypothetical protein